MIKTGKTGLSAGRPSTVRKATMEDTPRLVRFNAQITEDEHTKLKLYAVKNKVSISSLLRGWIAALPDGGRTDV